MTNFLYKLLLTFNSTSLMLVLYCIKEEKTIPWEKIHLNPIIIPDYISYILYFLTPMFLTLLSIYLANRLDNDNIEKGRIIEVEQANNAFLPSYLGYFFVALSVDKFDTLTYVFSILFLFTYFSQTLYFNPLFLIFKYKFYYVTTSNKVKIFIITRKILKNPSNIELQELKRINDFTFIDKEN